MSGGHEAHDDNPAPGGAHAQETSVDDILASIRRILSEEESPVPGHAPHAGLPHPEPEAGHAEPEPDHAEDVLHLDRSMLVHPANPAPFHEPPRPYAAPFEAPPMNDSAAVPPTPEHPPHAGLVAPAAAAAAASSVGELVRTLATERHTGVSRGGPTIEDLVRDEMRPVLKEWLDTHLPPLVERLVRAEIERVVARAS